MHVDHFIPWSYIFEDEIWNLVLACEDCNKNKRDSLYPSNFIEKILGRNTKNYNVIEGMSKSLARLDPELNWKKEIHRQYQSCKDQGFIVKYSTL